MSYLSSEEVAGLRNIVPDNHNSFPGFNLDYPLLALPDASMWDQPEAQWREAQRLADAGDLAYESGGLKRLSRLVYEFPRRELGHRIQSAEPAMRSTVALIDRLSRADPDPELFLRRLIQGIVAATAKGIIPRDTALGLLFGKPNKKKKTLQPGKATLILDVADMENFPYRVADPALARFWSDLLTASERPASESLVCALSGASDAPVGDKMPNPTLPILGKTFLMSMNADAPCQKRYGKIAMDIFPAGKRAVQNVTDALQFITDKSRRNRTWSAVPSAFKERSDLLISYLEEEPDSEVPVAGLFADLDQEADTEQAVVVYEERAALIHSKLHAKEKAGRDIHIRVIALSEIDPGRKQVLFSGRYDTNLIYRGWETWRGGARNIPLIRVPEFVGKGQPVMWVAPEVPSPSQVMRSFKCQWVRAGETSQAVPGVDLGRIYSLLLDRDASREAAWLMDRYVGLITPLLIGLGGQFGGGKLLSDQARREARIAVAVCGLLLFRQGRKKEEYMTSRDYLMGQFLQFADLLHKLYCKQERGGSIPPQLIGNAAIPMAMQNPRRALEVLATRMAVYLAWAERYSGEEAGLVKWTRKELGRVSAQLKDQDLGARVSPNGKAEMLLGYLARASEREEEENTQQ